jgi:hypothetical protein
MGHGRRKDQRNDPRTQAEAGDNTNPRVCQRDIGYEEAASRTHHYANAETEVTGSNGATAGAGSKIIGT